MTPFRNVRMYAARTVLLGRGVSIHRQDCRNLLRLQRVNAARVIPVNWSRSPDRTFAAAIHITAYDCRGIMRDVTGVLSDLHVHILSMNTNSQARDGIVDMDIRITIHDLSELSQALGRVQGLSNVLSARWRT